MSVCHCSLVAFPIFIYFLMKVGGWAGDIGPGQFFIIVIFLFTKPLKNIIINQCTTIKKRPSFNAAPTVGPGDTYLSGAEISLHLVFPCIDNPLRESLGEL